MVLLQFSLISDILLLMGRLEAGGGSSVEEQLVQAIVTRADELLLIDGVCGTSQRHDCLAKMSAYYVLGLPARIGGKETAVPFEDKAANWPALVVYREYQSDGETPLVTEIFINIRRSGEVIRSFKLRCFRDFYPDFEFSCPRRSVPILANRRVLEDFRAIISAPIYYIGQNAPAEEDTF